ncbi:hypothetical protein IW262DRAFT_1465908 [Armillaria fumosa]|nr:hypothetical protein IW262DRAFT_1465908 [Armillaria fumosa]
MSRHVICPSTPSVSTNSEFGTESSLSIDSLMEALSVIIISSDDDEKTPPCHPRAHKDKT